MSLDAMKQALAALEAWNYLEDPKPDANVIAALRAAIEQAHELSQWQGLTDDEIVAAYGADMKYRDGDYIRYARAIEARLREKNS